MEGIWDYKLNGVPGGPHSLHPKCTVAKSALAQQAPDKLNFSGPDEKRDLAVDLVRRGPSLRLPQSPTLSRVDLGARDVSRTRDVRQMEGGPPPAGISGRESETGLGR